MTLTQHAPAHTKLSHGAKRFGYGVAIAVNGVLLYVVNNLLAWNVPTFLTEDFDKLLPVLNVSIVAGMIVNLMYFAYDEPWFKSLGQVVLACISLVVFARTLAVFPFDFSPYDFNWEDLTRVILILGMIGVTIGLIAESVKLVKSLANPRG